MIEPLHTVHRNTLVVTVVSYSICLRALAFCLNAPVVRPSRRALPMVVAMPSSCVRHVSSSLVGAGAEPAERDQRESQQKGCNSLEQKKKGPDISPARY